MSSLKFAAALQKALRPPGGNRFQNVRRSGNAARRSNAKIFRAKKFY
jgi:hypothetical protein